MRSRSVVTAARCTVTGRSQKPGDATFPGTIYETAKRLRPPWERVAVLSNHGDDTQVKNFFDQVEREHGAARHSCQQCVRDNMNQSLRPQFLGEAARRGGYAECRNPQQLCGQLLCAPMMVPQRRVLMSSHLRRARFTTCTALPMERTRQMDKFCRRPGHRPQRPQVACSLDLEWAALD